MAQANPLEMLRGKYAGPGVAEWVLGLASTALLAGNLQARFNMEGVQNANRYYFRVGGVSAFQNLGVAVDLVVVLGVVGWLLWPARRNIFQWVLVIAALVGPPLIWGEIALALSTQPNPVFVLDGLPYRPVNNVGIVGSSVFWLYLLGKQLFAKQLWLDLVVKAVGASLIVVGQVLAFQALAARHGR